MPLVIVLITERVFYLHPSLCFFMLVLLLTTMWFWPTSIYNNMYITFSTITGSEKHWKKLVQAVFELVCALDIAWKPPSLFWTVAWLGLLRFAKDIFAYNSTMKVNLKILKHVNFSFFFLCSICWSLNYACSMFWSCI